jgi:hypothetical protein
MPFKQIHHKAKKKRRSMEKKKKMKQFGPERNLNKMRIHSIYTFIDILQFKPGI